MTEMEARANENLVVGEQSEDVVFDRSLRPARFEDFVGQERIKDNLRVFVEAARQRGEPIDHTLFCGPPGLGKTTLAVIVDRVLWLKRTRKGSWPRSSPIRTTSAVSIA